MFIICSNESDELYAYQMCLDSIAFQNLNEPEMTMAHSKWWRYLYLYLSSKSQMRLCIGAVCFKGFFVKAIRI